METFISADQVPVVVTFVFYMLGNAVLLPWNFFITAETYWQYKLRNTSLDYVSDGGGGGGDGGDGGGGDDEAAPLTPLQLSFTPTLVIVSNFFSTLFFFVTSAVVRKVSEPTRVYGSLGSSLAVMLVITLLTFINTDQWQEGFYVITMICVAILSMCMAITQGSASGLAGLFPASCMATLMSGQALAGVFSSVARIISLLVGEEPITSGLVFFSISDVFLAATIASYWFFRRMNYYKEIKNNVLHHTSPTTTTKKRNEEENEGNVDKKEEEEEGGREGEGEREREEKEKKKCEENGMVDYSMENKMAAVVPTKKEDEEESEWRRYLHVFLKIWPMGLTVGLTLLITLTVFPAVVVYITSTMPKSRWTEVFFQPTITFLLFNVGDVIGREVTRWLRWPGPKGWLLHIVGASRLIFIPLLMLCHGDNKTFPTLFDNDAYYIIINLLFSISNGYIITLTFIYYQTLVEADELEMGGAIMVALVGVGLVIGSLISPGFVLLWGPQ